ncbi:hypothetical protein BJX63DRAFT_428229 [Aspergillus granulosus]|uniref:Azaphilone pigments biosynthesis cluster protein L N-terminal domain-containing protein n=1 Tax=Aspergillus granulosus TaxID=176169 RepID=A0ABR4HY23_9EURO
MPDQFSILGVISASSSLGKSAVKSAIAAYELLSRYRDYPETVEHLKTEVYGMKLVLQQVENMPLDDSVLPELEPILKGCHTACSGLQQVIMKCTARNGGNQPSFQDWAKMEFLGGTISDLKETLKGYKGTIAIIIATISIDLGQMSSCQLADYQRAITDTGAGLTKLQSVSRRSTKRQEEQEKIKEVEDAITLCIEACRKAGSAIEQVRLESFDIFTNPEPEKSLTSRRIWQMTDEDFNHVRKYLSASELKLLEIKKQELEDKHQKGDRECLFDRINEHCRSVLHKKEEEAQRERTLRFENIACKAEAIQIIRSTPGSSLSAKDIIAETKSSQALGDNPPSAIEKLIENHGAAQRDSPPRPSRSVFGFFMKSNRKGRSYS